MIEKIEKVIKLTKKIDDIEITSLVNQVMENECNSNHYDRLIWILENELKINPK